MSKIDYNEAGLAEIVKGARSYSDVLRRLGLRLFSGNFQTLQRKIAEFGIDTSHFTGRKRAPWNKGSICGGRWGAASTPLSEILSNKRPYSSVRLKKRLVAERILPNKCASCGQGDTHNGKVLVLQLDHINGDHLDNSLGNLRILCPNCHSQTESYGRGRRQK